MNYSLQNKVAVVTGASSGLGEAIARTLADNGAIVYLAARSMDRLSRIAGEIKQAGGRADPIYMNVTRAPSVRTVGEHVHQHHGRIDIWVNNAGGGKKADLEGTTPELLEEMMALNYYGLVNGTREAERHMRKGGGDIVQILSTSAYTPRPDEAAYVAAKAAADIFSKSIQKELMSRDIRVILIYPGGMKTEFAQKAGLTPPPNAIDPNVVAGTVLYALSLPRNVIFDGRLLRSG